MAVTSEQHDSILARLKFLEDDVEVKKKTMQNMFDTDLKLRSDLDAATSVINQLQKQVQVLTEAIQKVQGTHQKPWDRSIMNAKAFNKLTTFKGVGFRQFRKQLLAIIKNVYGKAGEVIMDQTECLAKDGKPIIMEDIVLNSTVSEDIVYELSNDLHAVFQFILENEPADIEANADGGLDCWAKLWYRFYKVNNSRTVAEMSAILSPEPVKTISEVLPAIERWLERIKRHPKGDKVEDEFKAAIVAGICPKRLREHLQLHVGEKSFAEVRSEIVRVVDGGLFGRLDKENDEGKGHKPMEVDPLYWGDGYGQESDDAGYHDLSYMQKGKGKGDYGKGWGGKGGGAKGWKGKGKGGKGDDGKGEGKGKGEAKGKGKGGQPAEFQGYCSYCWKWGHTQRFCKKKEADWWGHANLLEGTEDEKEQGCTPDNEKCGEYRDLGGLFTLGDFIVPKKHRTVKIKKGQAPPVNDFIHNKALLQAIEEEDDLATEAGEDEWMPLTQFDLCQGCAGSHAPESREKGLVKIQIMGDSGAADCVLPKAFFPEVPTKTDGPKVGMKYTAANGKPIYNEGVKTLVGKTVEGHRKKIDFEVADVNKPLASFRKIAKKGHRIVLDDDEGAGGYIEDKKTKQRTQLYIENEVYKFDLYVDVGASAGFTGQGGRRH